MGQRLVQGVIPQLEYDGMDVCETPGTASFFASLYAASSGSSRSTSPPPQRYAPPADYRPEPLPACTARSKYIFSSRKQRANDDAATTA